MTAITAAQVHRAAINLYIEPTESIAEVTRTDANGTATVRVPPFLLPRAGVFTLRDWEAAITGTVTYTAGDAVARVRITPPGPWLVFPFRPGLGLELEQVNDYSAGRASLSVVSQVPGRPDPLVALGGLASRTGSMDILCSSLADVRRLEDALNRFGPAMLKTPDQPGMDMYFTASDISTKPADNGRWMASMSYLETAPPSGNVPAWTVSSVASSFASFNAARDTFADFDSMTLNDRTA